NASAGAVNYWVRVPTVSHTTDTTFYMCYGNAGITTDQSNKTAVWDANYKAVWHLTNGTTLSAADSTSNANNGTIIGSVAITGQIDGGVNFPTAGDRISINSISLSSGVYTISTWFKS